MLRPTPAPTVWLTGVLLAGAAACSGSSDRASDASPLPTLPTAAPTATATATATAAATPTPVPSAAPTRAPSPTATPAPPARRRVPALDRDVDGDGKADLLRTREGLLTVVLSGSGRTVTAPVHAESPGSPAVLGTADVDRDGFAEVFVETAQGASTSFATPYRFDGTALHELQLDGGPARLGIGGSVTHGDGFRCTPAGLLEVRSSDSPDGATYTVHVSAYRLTTSELVLVRATTSSAPEGDPAVEASYSADCGTVGDGG